VNYKPINQRKDLGNRKRAIIIGAGPAGLTAGYELLQNTGIRVLIVESLDKVGGISRTVNHNGNRMDIGGHRFFSKSEWVKKWWLDKLPLQNAPAKDDKFFGNVHHNENGLPEINPEKQEKVMLKRKRYSRIFFLNRFVDYPLSLNLNTLRVLGLGRSFMILLSYFAARLFPVKKEESLEDFLVNRFGRRLYELFFKHYTKKIWGRDSTDISAEWGAQRIKGVSVTKALTNAFMTQVLKRKNTAKKEASLIDEFWYPKYGPGQLWEIVATEIHKNGGEIMTESIVTGVKPLDDGRFQVKIKNIPENRYSVETADFVLSSMPVKDLIRAMGDKVPARVREIGNGLIYRSFITVGLLLKNLGIENRTKIKTPAGIVPDNWIYIQDKTMKLGRLQIFNNWSPYMVADEKKIWVGLEFFCDEDDEFWNKTDEEIGEFAIDEFAGHGFCRRDDVVDYRVERAAKAYPAYFGAYKYFDEVRRYLDDFENLFLIGRNGMHRYNNADHSMLTAKAAVDNIIAGRTGKENIWDINSESDYHEE
jgi:protoporphyrinogen oxidase